MRKGHLSAARPTRAVMRAEIGLMMTEGAHRAEGTA